MNLVASMHRLAQCFMRSRTKQLFLAIALLTFSRAAMAQTWQTNSVSVTGGGTLSYQVEQPNCNGSPGSSDDYLSSEYRDLTYTPASGPVLSTSPIGMSPGNGYDGICSGNYGKTSPVTLVFGPGTYSISFNYVNHSATLVYSATVDPKFKVISILYAMPGNVSSNSFTNTTTNGTVTTIGSNFSTGSSSAFSLGFLGSGINLNYGISKTTGKSNAYTETIADAASIGNASNSSSPNTVEHNQDLFLIWLNPEVVLTSLGTSTLVNYTMQTQSLNGVTPEPVDNVEVTAEVMQSNNGVTTIPLSLLQKQFDAITGSNDLPGLASVCANQSQYANNCPSGGQCGCVPSDFTAILAQDPLLTATTSTNPMTVDTSGITTCTKPTATSSCRYVPVPASKGSTTQLSTLLAGPNCTGCNRPVNSNAVTDSTSTTVTMTETKTESAGYTAKGSLPFGIGSYSTTATWSWTDTESNGSVNGQANQLQYSLSSSTVGCNQDVLIYEDTVYHTFVVQQAPGNNSCP
ncbi:MAG TPA: hypothetical protein VGG18_06760 [Granulicella sp.]|jgi:Na+-translocating ferredoxin:NAD+ oxidoreductase RNF subunit RnfB